MRLSPNQRIKHLENLEKHIKHILLKRGIEDDAGTFVNELIYSVDMEIFLPTMKQEEWEALPLDEKYTAYELEEILESAIHGDIK